ncbi:MAG: hypothetical protein NTU85_01730 [Candidatus Kaiserbacteria bacterium]|nr:hypothetical protein [Candidatus Kaiserbacteria bacterium]
MKETITTLLVLIIGITIGFAGGKYINIKVADSSCEAKLAKAKAMFPSAQDVRGVSGKISGINGNTVTIAVNETSPFDDSPTAREVVVGENTKIVKMDFKDQTVFKQELEEYQKITSAQTDKTKIPTPPIPFTEKEISLSDLKVGDQITVEAGENIKTETKFTATKITLQVIPAVSKTAPAAPN